MADWRQIQARIRKAKNSQDPHAKLYELFQRTRDGMVAWELAVLEEKNGRSEEAGRWYINAAQRFRRSDWKKKAEEALTRLGIELPAAETPASTEPMIHASPQETSESTVGEFREKHQPLAAGEIAEESESAPEAEAQEPRPAMTSGASGYVDPGRKKRRRGRRGGRGRRHRGVEAPSLPAQSFAEPTRTTARPSVPAARTAISDSRAEAFMPPPSAPLESPRASLAEHPEPQLPSERNARGRSDPGLASRMAQLESMLRRLLSSQLHRVDETDEAPASPGVFLLSDSDQIASYYIEACQTLRVGLANLIRGGRTARGARGGRASDINLKAKLAEHLEISEAKVGQYLKDHCAVRWIQLDDDAPHLAHFAIGVLRTPLNSE